MICININHMHAVRQALLQKIFHHAPGMRRTAAARFAIQPRCAAGLGASPAHTAGAGFYIYSKYSHAYSPCSAMARRPVGVQPTASPRCRRACNAVPGQPRVRIPCLEYRPWQSPAGTCTRLPEGDEATWRFWSLAGDWRAEGRRQSRQNQRGSPTGSRGGTPGGAPGSSAPGRGSAGAASGHKKRTGRIPVLCALPRVGSVCAAAKPRLSHVRR